MFDERRKEKEKKEEKNGGFKGSTIPSGDNYKVANIARWTIDTVLGRFFSDWQVATKRIFCFLTLDLKTTPMEPILHRTYYRRS